jgi:hypothetical protein
MDQGFSEVEGKLSREIAALFDLGVSELKNRWRFVYGTEPASAQQQKAARISGRVPHAGASFRRAQTLSASPT